VRNYSKRLKFDRVIIKSRLLRFYRPRIEHKAPVFIRYAMIHTVPWFRLLIYNIIAQKICHFKVKDM